MASAHIELDVTVAVKGGDILGVGQMSVPLKLTATHGTHAVALHADTADVSSRIAAGLAAFKAAVEK